MALTQNDLLVLGLLLDRPMHGYEISQYIKSEGMTVWFDISMAAIYYSLNKLHQQKLVSETRSRSGGAEKSVYHLTERGREQFFASMKATLSSEEPLRFEYDLGIFLLNKLPQVQALDLLEKRLAFLKGWSATLEQALEQERARGERPLQIAILDRSATCTRLEARWLADITRRLRGEEVAVGERERGLMMLSGDLQDFHLLDLIKLIVSGKHSGTMTVSDGVSTRTLSFHEGRPVCASSSRAEGEVSEPEQVMNDVYDLFRWQEGAFTFDQQVEPRQGSLALHLSAKDLILAGARWVDNWATIQHTVPAPDTVFERRGKRIPPKELDLTEKEKRVLESLDGVKDVTAVARRCGLTEFETSKVLYGLCAVGLVQPGDLRKIRLRRVFRELAELTCQVTLPQRAGPDDFACEINVNQRCADLPVRFVTGRIEDRTDPGLRAQELAEVYRRFLRTQRAVVQEQFGEEVTEKLLQQVLSQISPSLRDALQRYKLV